MSSRCCAERAPLFTSSSARASSRAAKRSATRASASAASASAACEASSSRSISTSSWPGSTLSPGSTWMRSTMPGMRGRTSTSRAGSIVPVATTMRSMRPRSTLAVAGGGAASPPQAKTRGRAARERMRRAAKEGDLGRAREGAEAIETCAAPPPAPLCVAHPVAVEAERHPLRQRHLRERRLREALRVEDRQLACVRARVVHERKDVALVLARAGAGGYEHALARGAAGAEVVLDAAALLEVVLEQPAEALVRAADGRDRVAVAMASAGAAVVDARELDRALVEPLLLHRAAPRVDREAMRGRGVECARARAPQLRIARDVEHDPAVRRVVGVPGMEHVGRP